jgi:hypothetical protein
MPLVCDAAAQSGVHVHTTSRAATFFHACNHLGVIRALVLAALVALVAAGSARAAAPRYILVSGPGLPKPVLLANWQENLRFELAAANAPRARPSATLHRPRYDLALFWGWTDEMVPTRPTDANQHGWFYPALVGRRALIDLMVNGVRAPRVAPVELLVILKLHGVPIHR